MKKILSILLCLFLLWSTAPVMEAAGVENFLQNPSFDQSGEWFSGGGGSMTTAKKRTGTRSAVLTSTGSGVWLAQSAVEAFPGAEYELSAYFLQEKTLTDGVRFKVEFYTDKECTSPKGWVYSPYMEANGDGEWHLRSFTFTAPADIYGFLVYIRLDVAGTLYADDMVLRSTAPLPAFSLTTDQVLYYTQWGGTVKATARMHPTFYPELIGGSVKFSLQDGTQTVNESVSVYPYQESLIYSPELSLLRAEGQEYTVSATAYDKNGREIYTAKTPVYRFDRPTLLDDAGNIIINNQPFIPVYFYYNPFTVEGMKRDKAMGANTIILENWMMPDPDLVEDTLDMCRDNGMKALIRLYYKMKPAGHPDNEDIVETVLERIHDHTALLGYILMDEPGGVLQNEYEDDLLNSYLLVRKYDSVHPSIINEAPVALLGVAGRYCDILSHDPYPGQTAAAANTYTSHVTESIKKAVEAVGGKKPVYAVLQAFDYMHFNPDATQLRQMFYQALAAGAKGFGYYSQKAVWNTKLKEGLLSFASSEQAAALAAVNNNTLIKEDTASYAIRMWQSGKDTYVLLLNLQKDADSALQMHFWGNKVPTAYAIGGASGLLYQNSSDIFTFSVKNGSAVLLKLPEGEAAAHLLSDAFHVHLEDKDGNVMSQIRGGENFAAVLRMGNTENNVKSYFGAAALYAKAKEGQKELIKIVLFSPTVPALKGTKPGEYRLDIPFDMNGQGTRAEYFIKLLLWTNRAKMIPAEIPGTGVEIG